VNGQLYLRLRSGKHTSAKGEIFMCRCAIEFKATADVSDAQSPGVISGKIDPSRATPTSPAMPFG
jgi:hypothetical protein